MDKLFEPSVWPEHAPPPHAKDCTRCELAKHRPRVIWGEGNPQASRLVLLDNPGAREDREGREYVCGTRDTLQSAAAQAGLTEQDLYVTYLLKCRPLRAYDKEAARNACMGHLMEQLAAIQPKAVLCLGNVALRSFVGDPDAEVKTMRGAWHEARGYRFLTSYHPLAVRRRPNLWTRFLEDVQMFAAEL